MAGVCSGTLVPDWENVAPPEFDTRREKENDD